MGHKAVLYFTTRLSLRWEKKKTEFFSLSSSAQSWWTPVSLSFECAVESRTEQPDVRQRVLNMNSENDKPKNIYFTNLPVQEIQ